MRQQEIDPYRIGYQRHTVHWNAFQGKYSLMVRWLAGGGNINKRDRRGQTPLFAATHGRQHRIVDFLIAHGADVNISSHEAPYHTYPIQTAVYNGELDIVKSLLAAGADISVRTSNGCTLLHLAAFHDHVDIAELLLKLGMDVDATTGGQTPLRAAAMHSHYAISTLFLMAGANANAIDKYGFNPLFEVADVRLIKALGTRTKILLPFDLPACPLSSLSLLKVCPILIRRLSSIAAKHSASNGRIISDRVP